MATDASPGAGRVLVALSDGPLVAEPTWTRYDELENCRLYEYGGNSGRQSELDVTETGEAHVYFNDRSGVLDSDDLIGKQIMLQLHNPVTDTWEPRWRGHIDDVNHDLDPSLAAHATVQFECVDVFSYLGGARFVSGMGDSIPSTNSLAYQPVVFYEDGNVDDRIIALLTDGGIAATMRVVFTGNVSVNECIYSFDSDVILQALKDAADAEFPGIGNVFVDRYGRVAFHGRFARFDPEGVAASASNWNFTRWHAGTRADVVAGVAQVRPPFGFNRPSDRIINSYNAWPRQDHRGMDTDNFDLAGLLQQDAVSQAAHGFRGKEAPDLIIKANTTNGNTGLQECVLFGQFYITNYAQPRKAIQQITFKAIRPDDPRAADIWALMCGIDVSDAVNLTAAEALLTDEPFFVDGLSWVCRPAGPTQDYVEVTPNLTPASYYGTDVFTA